MHRSPRFERRSALVMLAAWPLGMTTRRAAAAPPVQVRQTDTSRAVLPPGALPPSQMPQAPPRMAEIRQAQALAHAEFSDPQGVPHRLSELTRPLVVVSLWAAWCPGCLEELPTMRALAALLGPDTIDIVLLSHEMNWLSDQAYARNARLPFRQWRLSARAPDSVVSAAFRIEADRFALPQSLVFAGREQTLVRSQEGSQDWSAPDQVRLARAWLAAAR